jgi:hypothetical protein
MQKRRNIVFGLSALALVIAMSAAAADSPATAVAPSSAKVTDAAATPSTSASNNQIWECTTKGVRTFSSNPCGTKSTVRELNPINVMEPVSTYLVTHTYAPSYAPNTSATPASNYSSAAQESNEETYADTANAAYPGYVVVPRLHRVRPHNAHDHPRPHHP